MICQWKESFSENVVHLNIKFIVNCILLFDRKIVPIFCSLLNSLEHSINLLIHYIEFLRKLCDKILEDTSKGPINDHLDEESYLHALSHHSKIKSVWSYFFDVISIVKAGCLLKIILVTVVYVSENSIAS